MSTRLKYIALLTYLLLLLGVFTLLVKEWQDEVPVFSLSATATKSNPGQVSLGIYGEHFHPGVKGVLAQSLVKEDALLWHHYKEIPFRLFDKRENLLLASYHTNKLVSISLSEDAAPKLLGSIEVDGPVGHIKIIGNKAVVGMTRSYGVSFVDMSDPEHLTLAAHYPVSGSVYSIVEDQGVVYFTGVGVGVSQLNLAEKNPELVTFATPDSPWRMAIQGKRLAVATLKGRVHLFEIGGQGRQPVEVGVLDFPGAVLAVAFTDEQLVVTVADKSLSVLSLSDWPSLAPAGVLNLPGKPLGLEKIPGRESVVVNLISNGFCLVDVSQAQKPVIRGRLKLPQAYQNLSVSPEQIIATGITGLQAFSLGFMDSDGTSGLASDAVVTQESYRLESWGQYVYGFDKQGVANILGKTAEKAPHLNRYLPFIDAKGIEFFEQQEDGQLHKVGSLALGENVLEVQYRGGYLYALYDEGLRVFSGESPETMVAISDLLLAGSPQKFVFLNSGVMMISSKDQGLWVVDVENPEKPKLTTRLTMPGHLQGSTTPRMLVDGPRLYVSQGVGGVQVFDISTPMRPELIQVVDTPGYATEMTLHDDLLLVVDGLSGLFVVDVEDSKQALPVGSLPMPLRIDQVAVAEDGLIISSKHGGTMKLPLLQKLRGMRMVNEGEMTVDVTAVEKGQYVYLYDERSAGRIALNVQ